MRLCATGWHAGLENDKKDDMLLKQNPLLFTGGQHILIMVSEVSAENINSVGKLLPKELPVYG